MVKQILKKQNFVILSTKKHKMLPFRFKKHEKFHNSDLVAKKYLPKISIILINKFKLRFQTLNKSKTEIKLSSTYFFNTLV